MLQYCFQSVPGSFWFCYLKLLQLPFWGLANTCVMENEIQHNIFFTDSTDVPGKRQECLHVEWIFTHYVDRQWCTPGIQCSAWVFLCGCIRVPLPISEWFNMQPLEHMQPMRFFWLAHESSTAATTSSCFSSFPVFLLSHFRTRTVQYWDRKAWPYPLQPLPSAI